MEYDELMRLAHENLTNAYAPYSGVQVSAAILCESGEVFRGVNVENASYGATICAERAATVAAVSSGNRDFKAIAITSSLTQDISPCGICRQVLFEFNENMDVVLGKTGDITVHKLNDLLPSGFGKDDLQNV